MTIDHLRTAIAEQVPRLQSWEVDGLAKKLEREGLLRPEWIPVAERLPELGVPVLCLLDDGSMCDDYRVKYKSGREEWEGFRDFEVSHWQRRPEAPK